MVGLPYLHHRRGYKGALHEGHVTKESCTAGVAGSLCNKKASPLASHSEGRVAAAAMTLGVARLWDKLCLNVQFQESLL